MRLATLERGRDGGTDVPLTRDMAHMADQGIADFRGRCASRHFGSCSVKDSIGGLFGHGDRLPFLQATSGVIAYGTAAKTKLTAPAAKRVSAEVLGGGNRLTAPIAPASSGVAR